MKTLNFFLVIMLSIIFSNSFSQKIVRGTVVDEYYSAIPGATVSVKERRDLGTLTDLDGNFTLNIPSDSLTLVISFIGLETREIKVSDINEKESIMLKSSDDVIEEVVVTAVGVTRDSKRYERSELERSTKKEKSSSVSYFSAPSESRSLSYDYEYAPVKGTAATKSYEYSYDDISTGGPTTEEAKSGLLTAGEIHDFSKWKLWNDITENELNSYQSVWKFYPKNRYCVQLTSKDGKPLINKKLELVDASGKVIWSAVSDNTGKAELWNGIYNTTKTKTELSIKVDIDGAKQTIKNPTKFHDGINFLSVDAKCVIPSVVDIAFVVDATGSMSDEISYLKEELMDIMQKAKQQNTNILFNLGSVFYRDHGDTYLTVKHDLTPILDSAINFVREQYAGGGGDFPEAVDAGLEVAVNQLKWSENAIAKVVFLILDAPPHTDPQVIENLQKITEEASKKGIRIVPVTCSGIDKSTEYLMRSLALATNGTYVFLTDDSGIGDSHIAPTTDEYEVEYLNGLILRLLKQYTETPTCENKLAFEPAAIKDTTIIVIEPIATITNVSIADTTKLPNPLDVLPNKPGETVAAADSTATPDVNVDYSKGIKFYPNPTTDLVNIEFTGDVEEIYVADNSGKLLQRYKIEDNQPIQISLGIYPSGMYFIQYLKDDQWKSGRIILMRN